MTAEQRLGRTGGSGDIWGKKVPGRGNSKCPELHGAAGCSRQAGGRRLAALCVLSNEGVGLPSRKSKLSIIFEGIEKETGREDAASFLAHVDRVVFFAAQRLASWETRAPLAGPLPWPSRGQRERRPSVRVRCRVACGLCTEGCTPSVPTAQRSRGKCEQTMLTPGRPRALGRGQPRAGVASEDGRCS